MKSITTPTPPKNRRGAKSIKILIFLLMGSFASLRSQPTQAEWEEFQDVFNYTIIKLDASRDSVRLLGRINVRQDSIIRNERKIHGYDSAIVLTLRSEIDILKKEMTIKPPPLFEWNGCFIGIGTAYRFDSTIVNSTIVNKLSNELFLFSSFRVTVQGKLSIEGELGIPFTSKPYIGIKAGYRVF